MRGLGSDRTPQNIICWPQNRRCARSFQQNRPLLTTTKGEQSYACFQDVSSAGLVDVFDNTLKAGECREYGALTMPTLQSALDYSDPIESTTISENRAHETVTDLGAPSTIEDPGEKHAEQ